MKLIDNRNSSDPRINLALEEHVVRNRREGDFLLVYVNRPCVVLGKHQNLLEEADTELLAEQGVPVIRRISGGGTVYHDEGNLNFCVVTDHTLERHNNYAPFLAPIIGALRELGVASRLNNRNSLVLEDGRKISGNAQFASRDRMLSHGTLLFNSDLERLNAALAPNASGVESTAVQSVRSSVANLIDVLPAGTTMETFRDLIVRAFAGHDPEIAELEEEEWEDVRSLADDKYGSWEWNVGRSPRFSVRHVMRVGDSTQNVRARVVDGIIRALEIIDADSEDTTAPSDLVGCRYDPALFADDSDASTRETPINGSQQQDGHS